MRKVVGDSTACEYWTLNKLLELQELVLFSCLPVGICILVSISLPTCECLLDWPAFHTTSGVGFAVKFNIKSWRTVRQKDFLFSAETYFSISSLFVSHFLEKIVFNFNNYLLPPRQGQTITQPSHEGARIFSYTDNVPLTTF